MDSHTFHLRLGHVTIPARDMQRMVTFYTEVLGFVITNRGEPVPGMGGMVFLSQDPTAHHQIVLVETAAPSPRGFMMADHLALRADGLGDLREIHRRLLAAQLESVLPIDHGNAWSVYFTDPEGNGLECFVDTPFHVAQPFADQLDLDASDEAIEQATRQRIASLPEFQPFEDWQASLVARLEGGQ